MAVTVKNCPLNFLFVVLIAMLNVGGEIQAAGSSSALQKSIALGRDIYTQGKTTSGHVYMAGMSSAAPSKLFPCINCHGRYGEGKTEAGIIAPVIQRSQLDYNYRLQPMNQNGFTLYDLTKKVNNEEVLLNDGALKKSLMPRYELTKEELRGLFDYLAVVDQVSVPGMSDNALNIAVILPANKNQQQITQTFLNEYFQSINKKGGRYQRNMHLDFIPRDRFDIKRVLEEYFFLINVNLEGQIIELPADSESISLSLFSRNDHTIEVKPMGLKPSSSYALYGQSTIEQIHQVLKNVAAEQGYLLTNSENPCAEAAQLENTAIAVSLVEGDYIFPNNAKTKKNTISRIKYLRSLPCSPLLFVPENVQAQQEVNTLLKGYKAPVIALIPPTPQLVDAIGQQQYLELIQKLEPSFSNKELALQMWLGSASQLLDTLITEGGRQIDADSVKLSLGKLYRYTNHFGPDLSFVGNRTVGAEGAVLVQVGGQQKLKNINQSWREFSDKPAK